jgi:flagellar hook-length control protein FliK
VESNVEIKLDNKEGFDSQQQKEFSGKDFTQQKAVQDIPKEDAPVIRTEGFAFAENRTQVQFIPEEQIVYLPSGETVTAEKIVSQLVEQARILNEAETTTMEMTLNPEGLGKIYMEVTQKGDEITARIFTENDAVKQALEAQMANMKVEMNQSSTKVTSIEVSVGTHEFERNLEEDAKGEERREEQSNNSQGRSSKINLNNMDELSGLMSEEDILIAQMMKDNGNTLDFQA